MSSLNLTVTIGQRVQLADGRVASVRYKGSSDFAPGEWIGLELDEPTGKNNGEVKGKRYFDCEPEHGIFVRPPAIAKVLTTNGTRTSMAPPPAKPRPSSIGLGQSTRARESIASPGPARVAGSRLSGLRSPAPSPTKSMHAANSSGSSRTSTPPIRSAAPSTTRARQSVGPFSNGARRLSTAPIPASAESSRTRLSVAGASMRAGTATAKPAATGMASKRLSVASHMTASSRASTDRQELDSEENEASISASPRPSIATDESDQAERPFTPQEDTSSETGDADIDVEATPRPKHTSVTPSVRPTTSTQTQAQRSEPSRPLPPTAPRLAASTSREVEDLRTKLRVIEKRRLEDREKLKALEKVQQDRDRFEAIIQKLQTKLQPQQQEIVELKRQLKETETRVQEIERIQGDHDIELENATLDREMAEEQYEAVQAELVLLKENYEEAQLELEILREENQELGKEMSPEDRTSQGWLQLERSNERYREALIRLRDVTHEQEAELKQQVAALEKDLEHFANVNEEVEALRAKLLESEAAIDDLRQQLELAQGSEELVEELSDRNMTLLERIDDLNATIEDLEMLKNVSDELEINHVEAEKQMQEEIDFKDSLISEQVRRAQEQQKALDDYEMTVARFREAFKNLQADLEDMRASKEITDAESEHLSSKSRALMDLNLKLQSSAAKTQIKALDIELQRLEADEAAQHLSIVQRFLPDSYQADRDSVLALLRAKRIVFKADLLRTAIKESMSHGTKEGLFDACSASGRLTWVSCMCHRFANALSECSADNFSSFGAVLYELDPIERTINTYIEAVKRENADWKQLDQDLKRSVAVLDHLSTKVLTESPSSKADEMIMLTSMLQSHMDTSVTALTLAREIIEVNSASGTSQDNEEGQDSENEEPITPLAPTFVPFFERIDTVLSQVRSAKVVASEMHKELAELRARHLCLRTELTTEFAAAHTIAAAAASFSVAIGRRLLELVDPTTDARHLTPHQVLPALISVAKEAFSLSSPESIPLSTLHERITDLAATISGLYNHTTDLSQANEFPAATPPWVQRSEAQAAIAHTSDTREAEITRLNSQLKDRTSALRNKERDFDDQAVLIETLTARAKEAASRTNRIAELETALAETKKAENELKAKVKTLIAEAARLRSERDELRSRADLVQSNNKFNQETDPSALGAVGRLEIARARAQVAALQGAVRQLSARAPQPVNDIAWLSQPLRKQRDTRQENARKEIRDTLMRFVDLASSTSMVSYARDGDRLSWRPARDTGSCLAARRREEVAAWRESAQHVLRRAQRNK